MAEDDSKDGPLSKPDCAEAPAAKDTRPLKSSVPATQRPRFPKPSITNRLEVLFPLPPTDDDV